MEFKVLEGSNGFIEDKLNELKKEFDIKILGISSSPRDAQLGVGGICIIFTIKELKEINIGDIKIPNKIDPQKVLNDYLISEKGEKIIKDVISKNISEKPKPKIKRTTKPKKDK